MRTLFLSGLGVLVRRLLSVVLSSLQIRGTPLLSSLVSLLILQFNININQFHFLQGKKLALVTTSSSSSSPSPTYPLSLIRRHRLLRSLPPAHAMDGWSHGYTVHLVLVLVLRGEKKDVKRIDIVVFSWMDGWMMDG